MSKVISFRLNKGNPSEAQAAEVLEAWCSNGYSVRYVITKAILKLNVPGLKPVDDDANHELNSTLDRVKMLLENIEKGGYLFTPEQQKNTARTNLTDNFVASVRTSAKSGMKSYERG